MASSCAPLVLRSNHSLLVGTASVERLVARAAEWGLPYLALTDRNNLYGAVPFYTRAREAGIKPILGAEIQCDGGTAFALARNLAGYSSLCKVLTRRHLQEDFCLADALAESQEGLHILTEDPALARALAGRVERDRLWLLLASPGRGANAWAALRRCAEELGIGVAASPDAYFLDKTDYPIHTTLAAIRENTLVSKLRPGDVAHAESCLPSPAEIERLFEDHPDALRNSRRIADDCNLDLPLGKPIFPKFSLPEGHTAASFLAQLCHEGMKRRYPRPSQEALRRLRHELEVIGKLGFAEYFIFVWDILGFARAQGIPTVGRGSGASALVSFVLGITQADPLKYDIPFERFLHMQRKDCPDLDLDLCWIKRDQLIESVYEKYGADRVAMVAIHSAFRLRSAFREVAKAFGVPNDAVNRMSHKLPYDSRGTVAEAVASTGADRFVSLNREDFASILRLAEAIRGFPHQLGTHCGGLVIGDRPLDNYVPLERAAKGIVITQYEKDAIEEIGLVKMDLLGNHGLTIRDETAQLVRKRGHSTFCGEKLNVPFSVERIPDNDPATTRLLAEARTLSCVQLESPAMRNLLTMLRTSSVRELMQALALIRPAPASLGMKEHFVRRVRGLERWIPPHPSLGKVLADTYGIMLYEDDAMLVAAAMANIPREEGDLMRRAISKGASREKLIEISRYFIARATANGVPLEAAADMWAQMAKFNSYSFCKAHAASYAILAWQLAYLKAHYPLEFMVSVLNHQWGMYPKRVHAEEARRLGIQILGPCVNCSERAFTLDCGLRNSDATPTHPCHSERSEAKSRNLSCSCAPKRDASASLGMTDICIRYAEARNPKSAIRAGLQEVKDLSERAIRSLLAERQRRPFDSLGDFLARVSIPEPEAENLILCGAFDFTGRNRPSLLLELKTCRHRESQIPDSRFQIAESSLFPSHSALRTPHPALALPDYSPEQKLAYELSILGFSVSQHPMALFRPSLQQQGMADSRSLSNLVGRRVRIAGLLAAVRPTPTKKGEVMQFATLEDEWGLFEATLFPQAARRFGHLLESCGSFLVAGRVEEQYGALTITASHLGHLTPRLRPRAAEAAGQHALVG